MQIPSHLQPFFEEYDTAQLESARDANLVMQRTLEFGTWEEIRWLFDLYGVRKIRAFLRAHGQRLLKPATFNYWRRLLGLRTWKTLQIPTAKSELWNH
ncbi:MAG: hypothetical protein OHK0031_03190 [Anaerolineales bacterium]